MTALDLKTILVECREALHGKILRAEANPDYGLCPGPYVTEAEAEAYADMAAQKMATMQAVLSEVRRWALIADTITADCDDGREVVSLGEALTLDLTATPDRSRSYGLKWRVDGDEPEDAEAEALLGLAGALRCYHLQKEQPCL